VGRRTILMIGTGLFVVWWTVVTILSSFYGKESNNNTIGSGATIAFIYLFGVTYSFSYTPLQALYPVECLKYETRAKGMGIFDFFTNIATLFNSYVISIVIEKISWGFCFLYIAWDILELIVIYLLYIPLFRPSSAPPFVMVRGLIDVVYSFVETRSRTLEEVNEIFKDPMPRSKSLQKHVILVTQNGILYQGLEGDLQNPESGLPSPEQKP